MRSMKRLSIALIAIGLSVPALANDMVSVPSQKGGFKISIDPLYLRKNDVLNVSDSNYDWGTYAQIGYLFPYTANDLTVNYTYLRSGEKESIDLDDANVEVGQRLTTGAFDVRLFSGIRYSHLNYELDKSLTSLFHGFGPRLGIDTRYQLGNCLGLDTHLNASFLAGTVSTRSAEISSTINRIVPEVDAKLGIDYTYPMQGKSAFAVEVGYQSNNYFNAFNGDLMKGARDVNFDGAYLEVKYYA